MLALAGVVVLMNLAVVDVPPVLQYLVYGGFFGAIGGNELVVRRERREGELPPSQVRHILRISVVLGVCVGVLAILVQAALALL
jgi:hypothetical protein